MSEKKQLWYCEPFEGVEWTGKNTNEVMNCLGSIFVSCRRNYGVFKDELIINDRCIPVGAVIGADGQVYLNAKPYDDEEKTPVSHEKTWFTQFKGIEWTGHNIAEVAEFLSRVNWKWGLRFVDGKWQLADNHSSERVWLNKGDVIDTDCKVHPASEIYRENTPNATKAKR